MSRTMDQRVESNLANVVYSQAGKLHGTYRGYIVDRQDKYAMGRIKVHIPELQRKEIPETNTVSDGYDDAAYTLEAIWVMPRRHHTSVHTVPWINQWVEIQFEDGDPTRGYYTNSIVHLDEPMYHLKLDGGKGHIPPTTLSDNYKLLTRESAEDSGEDITAANNEYRMDTSELMYILPDFGKKKVKELTNAKHIELVADSHNYSTARMGHYEVKVDNPDMSYMERRSGQKRSLVQHDTNRYIYLRNPEGDGLILHHGENGDNSYAELVTVNEHRLHMDDDLQQLYLLTHGGGAVACSDTEQELYIGYGTNYTSKPHSLTTLGSNRKYDAWYSRKTKMALTNVTATQYDENGGMGTSNITKQTCIIRGPANILMDGNTGYIFLNSM